jgi:hypothetical protein
MSFGEITGWTSIFVDERAMRSRIFFSSSFDG